MPSLHVHIYAEFTQILYTNTITHTQVHQHFTYKYITHDIHTNKHSVHTNSVSYIHKLTHSTQTHKTHTYSNMYPQQHTQTCTNIQIVHIHTNTCTHKLTKMHTPYAPIHAQPHTTNSYTHIQIFLQTHLTNTCAHIHTSS